MSRQIYFPPSIQRFEPKRIVFSSWMDHLPFGYDIVEAVRPRLLVELGTYKGLSFFAFCQSMLENDIDGVAYAIDSWEGDKHTDSYDESIYHGVKQHAREHYRGFTYLLKTYFNDALQHFDSESIDLLHIDGLHTYEAVREDFTNWYPKVKPGGIILLHDVMARIQDFGACKYFAELENDYDDVFRFNHGFGLGVLRKPGGPDHDHRLLNIMFSDDAEDREDLRRLYVHAGHFFDARRKVKRFKPKGGDKAGKGEGKA